MLTAKRIAEELQVSYWTVLRWLREGRLKGYSIGGKAGWRIREEDFEEFLSSLEGGRSDERKHTENG
ncbi:MAG TPA: helix-turn-helix domain-containing protein [Clostridia bacterium]|nr:helix-turn-helix domain-containing protein [Clostridia bacterium]